MPKGMEGEDQCLKCKMNLFPAHYVECGLFLDNKEPIVSGGTLVARHKCSKKCEKSGVHTTTIKLLPGVRKAIKQIKKYKL